MKPSNITFNENISNRNKFGFYIRNRREELNISLRDLASMLNLSPAYLSDIEQGNRPAPFNYLEKFVKLLKIEKDELDFFQDIAGCSHSNWPEINEYLEKMPSARKALRLARDKNLSGEEFLMLVNQLHNNVEPEL